MKETGISSERNEINMEFQVMRATETWQQAGAYYVRIQAMARQHHITLREEFDEHDTPDTKYIVVLDDDFPVATCRLYELPEETYGEGAPVRPMMFGRIVVLPEYRKLDCIHMEKMLDGADQ